jgi:hypothetical protein
VLTAEQEGRIADIRDEWLRIGLCTEPADRRAAEQGVHCIYRAAWLPPPRIIWQDSPGAAAVAMVITAGHEDWSEQHMSSSQAQQYWRVRAQRDAELRRQAEVDWQTEHKVSEEVYWPLVRQVEVIGARVQEQVQAQMRAHENSELWDQVYDELYGRKHFPLPPDQPVWMCLPSVYSGKGQRGIPSYAQWAAMEVLGVPSPVPFHHDPLVARKAGCWWRSRAPGGGVIVTDRPSRLKRDGEGHLHSADGMAIAYRDGWGFWCWHGRRVPRWVIEEPTVSRIVAEPNAEIRRCAIEVLGWERFASDAGLTLVGSCPDPGNPGLDLELYDVPERLWGSPVRLLLAWNGTVELDGSRRRFGLTVPADIAGPLAAAAWTYDDPSSQVRMTPELYSTITRRT